MSSDDFMIPANILVYLGDSPAWNTIAGVGLKIRNPTSTALSFVFAYDESNTTVNVPANDDSAEFTLEELPIRGVSVTEQGQPLEDKKKVPTVKHMSKGGGNYQRFDWGPAVNKGCAMLNAALTDKLMKSDLTGWATGRDANYTFEMIMHRSFDDLSFTITVSHHYVNSAGPVRERLFWWVDEDGNLALTPDINGASWFTRSATSTPFEIHFEGPDDKFYLALKDVPGGSPILHFDDDPQTALSITPTDVEWAFYEQDPKRRIRP